MKTVDDVQVPMRLLAAGFWAAAVALFASARAETIAFPDAPFAMPAIAVPQFAARDFSIVDFGAKEGVKATETFAKAMAACEAAGGGRVVVPKGTWLTGAVHFRNNCNLHLADGATLEFTDAPADYLPVVHTSWEGVECLNYSPLLYAYGVTNVAITGKGTIAPRMDFWKTWFKRLPEHMKATEMLYHWCSTNAVMSARDLTAIKGSNVRPHLIQFNRCENVLLDGFRIRESPFWTIHLYHSENCVVRNLDVYAHGHNNDGVDIEMTRNVLVENCRFDQGDDGIVLKAGRNQDAWRLNRPTENIVVRNCEFAFAHTLLGIGSELSGGIRNVWMHHCKLSTAFNLFFVKTNRRRGGFVKNIYFEDIESDNVKGAVVGIKTDVLYQWARFPDYELRRTEIDCLHIRNIRANCADHAIDIAGDAAAPVRNVEMANIWLGACRKEFEKIENAVDVVKRDVRLGNLAPKAWVRQIDEVWHHKSAVRVRKPNYDEAKVAPYTLEDPLAFADGRKLKDASEWPARRKEILEIFAREMFGVEPPAPEVVVTELREEGPTLAGLAIRRQYRMWFKSDKSGPFVDWLLVLPNRITGEKAKTVDGRIVCENRGKVPVVLMLNFPGNHAVLDDEEVPLTEGGWFRASGDSGEHSPQESNRAVLRRSQSRTTVPAEFIVSRGYAFLTACYAQVSPDVEVKKGDPEGLAYTHVFELWGKRDESRTDNTTALGAWAWALSRGLDLAETIPEIDAKRCVATGSSRLGKAALLASARDERFAVCVPNQTGGGGVPLAKRNFGENVSTEMASFPHWYCKAYAKYVDNEQAMKFDQHLLVAAIAPRALLVEGFNKGWFDAKGEWLSCRAASPVWEFLGKEGLPKGDFPGNYDRSRIGASFGYVRRGGQHGFSGYDWLWMLDFADKAFSEE